ncbi:hypothetical protein GIB67_021439 [Kingdonia uniflora]|uniref:Uncharacterized protein n=1 Tax=Kingdonia uniflora TaxID=39325 RepID=A0A7J7NQH5_9MAGN|nr:hypothetical protein GIB67_021439 [Kingdonia uniflora]
MYAHNRDKEENLYYLISLKQSQREKLEAFAKKFLDLPRKVDNLYQKIAVTAFTNALQLKCKAKEHIFLNKPMTSEDMITKIGVHHALNPDPYRGCFGFDGLKYAEDAQGLIDNGTSGCAASFITEAIQGVGGIVELAPSYLPVAYNSVKKAGGLCIADEVQLGFVRTRSHFWGFQAHGVVPDIVTMEKGIGNVLKVIKKEQLQQNAFAMESYLKERLMSFKEKYEIIGDVRG